MSVSHTRKTAAPEGSPSLSGRLTYFLNSPVSKGWPTRRNRTREPMSCEMTLSGRCFDVALRTEGELIWVTP